MTNHLILQGIADCSNRCKNFKPFLDVFNILLIFWVHNCIFSSVIHSIYRGKMNQMHKHLYIIPRMQQNSFGLLMHFNCFFLHFFLFNLPLHQIWIILTVLRIIKIDQLSAVYHLILKWWLKHTEYVYFSCFNHLGQQLSYHLNCTKMYDFT